MSEVDWTEDGVGVLPSSKALSRVLEAVYEGASHSQDVSELTGLSVAEASAHLSELYKMGLIRRTGRMHVWGGPGRSSYDFEPV